VHPTSPTSGIRKRQIAGDIVRPLAELKIRSPRKPSLRSSGGFLAVRRLPTLVRFVRKAVSRGRPMAMTSWNPNFFAHGGMIRTLFLGCAVKGRQLSPPINHIHLHSSIYSSKYTMPFGTSLIGSNGFSPPEFWRSNCQSQPTGVSSVLPSLTQTGPICVNRAPRQHVNSRRNP